MTDTTPEQRYCTNGGRLTYRDESYDSTYDIYDCTCKQLSHWVEVAQ